MKTEMPTSTLFSFVSVLIALRNGKRFSRRTVKGVSIPRKSWTVTVCTVLVLAVGCTTPEAVTQFTTTATQGAAQSSPLIRDITASCIRKQLADRPLNEIADVTETITNACKDFSDEQANLLGTVTVLTRYLNALAQLASDEAVTYDKQIDGFASTVQASGGFKDAQVTAVKGLAKFIADAAASGYQRRKLGSTIKAADEDIVVLTDSLRTIIGTDYDRVLRNEEESLRTRYRDAVQSDKEPATQLLVQERWRRELAIVAGKRQAAKDYEAILINIRDGHHQLALQVDKWDGKQLLQTLKPYAAAIQELVSDFKAAYFAQSLS